MNMNPEMMRNQMNMINGMSDEQLENMSRMSGMPMNAQMFRSMASMMQNMNDDQISGMTQQAQRMAQNGQVPAFAANNPAFRNLAANQGGNGNARQPNRNDNTNRHSAPQETIHPLEVELKEDLKIVDDLKNAANSKFKLKKYSGAKKLYYQALDEILELKSQNQDKDLAPLNKRIVSLKLNLALIMQKERLFEDMLKLSNESLDLDSRNSKAYYRKAIALSSLGKDEFAIVALKKAKEYYIGDAKGLEGVEELLKKLKERNGEEEEEEAEIVEEPAPQNPSPPPVNPPMPQGMPQFGPNGNAMPPLNQANLDMMRGMMSTPEGREMIRNMYRTQMGMELSDQQIEMMSNMMTPEMMAGIQNNPGMFNQGPRFQPGQQGQAQGQQVGAGGPVIQEVNPQTGQPVTNQGQQQPANTPPGMPPNNFDPQNMPKDLGSLFNNSQMIDTVFTMLKSNPAMLRMMFQQMGDNHPAAGFIKGRTDEQLKSLVIWMERLVKFIRFFWPAMMFIYTWRRTLGVLLVAFIIKRYFL